MPMTGNVLQVRKKSGDTVDVGETLLVISAMKLETDVKSTVKGKVLAVHAVEGDQVTTGELLVELEGQELIKSSDTTPVSSFSSVDSQAGSSGGDMIGDKSLSTWYHDGGASVGSGSFVPTIKSEVNLLGDKADARLKQNEKLASELTE